MSDTTTLEATNAETTKVETTTSKKSSTSRLTVKTESLDTFHALHKLELSEGTFTGDAKEYFDFLLSERKQNRTLKPVASEPTSKKSEEDKPKTWFTNLSGKTKDERETKLAEIKKTLGISDNDDIIMTRAELYAKASQLSGKSVDEILVSGAESEAQALITALRVGNEGAGKGRLGSADATLDTAFIELVGMIENGSYKPVGGLPITKIASRAGANFNSAKSWASRRGFTFPMDLEEASTIAAQLAEHGL